jgi:hypothetical protein
LREAILPLRGLLEVGDSLRPGDRDRDYGRVDEVAERYYNEIERALNKLDT